MDKSFNLGYEQRIYNNELRERRLKAGLSQKKLSKEIGIYHATISHIETFKKYPSTSQAKKICDFFGVEISQMFPEFTKLIKKSKIVENIEITPKQLESVEIKYLTDQNNQIDLSESLFDEEQLQKELYRVLKTLSPREEKVITLRFGLEFEKEKAVPTLKPRTLEEVGKLFKITRERVRQIEQKAIRKLKHPTRADFLKKYV